MSGRRITIVSSEPLGRPGTGGAGTADSLLAVALGRFGHDVELLIATGREIGELNPKWTGIYESAGVQVRMLEPLSGVRPRHLAPTLEVFNALRARPAEVAIVDDWRGLGYAALRTRELGRALRETAFIVHCHGPARMLAEFAGKVPDTVERFREEVTERASVGLADVVVSPSSWLLDWMRTQAWPLPGSARVIQYIRDSAALGEAPVTHPAPERVSRIAFFGQLREGKGLRNFIEALDLLGAGQLEGIELVFLGTTSARWPAERIDNAISPRVKDGLAGISFETELDRDAALAQLRRPGTLAVMPSLLDNSPNTVAECIEQGIPFIASDTGGIAELVAEGDRARVLARPRSADLAAALMRALAAEDGFAPARAAKAPGESLDAWLDLIDHISPPNPAGTARATRVTIVAQEERGAARLLERTKTVEVEVVTAPTRVEGLAAATADWLVFLDADDEPDDELIDELVAAQAASGADVVTCAVRPAGEVDGIQLFFGSPGALGLVENSYGVLALIRREQLEPETFAEGAVDPDWPLLATLALNGADIVSIPQPLATHAGRPGTVSDVPGEGLTVLRIFEANGRRLQDLPQLAATLAAAHARARSAAAPPQPSLPRRLARRVKGASR